MRKTIKIIFIFFGLFFTLSVAAVLYLANIDLNDHKDWLTTKFEQKTGYILDLQGDSHFTLYPWFGLDISQASILEPTASPSGQHATLFAAESLEARIKLIPLLQGDYEIDTLLLHNATLNLRRNNDGSDNWSGFRQDQETVPEAETTQQSTTLPHIQVGGIDVQNLNIYYFDGLLEQEYSLQSLSFTTEPLVLGEPIEVKITSKAQSKSPALDAELSVESTLRYDLDEQAYQLEPLQFSALVRGPDLPDGEALINAQTALSLNLTQDTLSISELSATVMDITINASLNGEHIQSSSPLYSGSILISGDGLDDLIQLTGESELAQQISSLSNQSINLNSSFFLDVERGDLEIPSLNIDVLDANIEGNLNARNIHSQAPTISGSLQAQGPDFPALLQLVGQLPGSKKEFSEYGNQLSTLPNDKGFVINTNFDANLDQGNIQVPLLNVQALGISLQGRLNMVNMQSASGTAEGEFELSAPKLNPLLTSLGYSSTMSSIDSLTAQSSISGNGQRINLNPFQVTIDLDSDSNRTGDFTIILNAPSILDLSPYSLSTEHFTVTGPDFNVSGELNAQNLVDSPHFEGFLDIPELNLRRLFNSINLPMPDSADPNTFESVAFSSNFEISEQLFKLEELLMKVDESELAGNLSLEGANENNGPTEFSLSLNTLNLDRYLTSTQSSTPPSNSSDHSFDLENLRQLSLQGEITIDELTYSNLTLNDITARLQASNGQFSISPIQANLYKGSYSGDIFMNVSQNIPTATMTTHFSDIDLSPLMQDYIGDSFVSGTGNINLSLFGSGDTTAAIRRTLAGSGDIDIKDGILSGVDVEGILIQLETMIRNGRAAQVNRGEQTTFDSFTSNFVIDQGTTTTNNLLMTAPGFSVTGSGTLIDLQTETVNINLLTQVDESTATNDDEEYDIGGYSVPISCTGSVSSPRCIPDIQQIIQSAISSEIRRQVGGLLQRALGAEEAPTTTTNPTSEEGSQELNQSDQDAEQEVDPRRELINRALENLLR